MSYCVQRPQRSINQRRFGCFTATNTPETQSLDPNKGLSTRRAVFIPSIHQTASIKQREKSLSVSEPLQRFTCQLAPGSSSSAVKTRRSRLARMLMEVNGGSRRAAAKVPLVLSILMNLFFDAKTTH